MIGDHFSAVVRVLNERRPFPIFTIELQRGARMEIDHPGAFFMIEEVALFISPGGYRIWFDHSTVNRIVEAAAKDIDPD